MPTLIFIMYEIILINYFFLIKSQVALPEELFKIPVTEMLESR